MRGLSRDVEPREGRVGSFGAVLVSGERSMTRLSMRLRRENRLQHPKSQRCNPHEETQHVEKKNGRDQEYDGNGDGVEMIGVDVCGDFARHPGVEEDRVFDASKQRHETVDEATHEDVKAEAEVEEEGCSAFLHDVNERHGLV